MMAFREDRRLSVGTVTLSTTPFHRGALDVYVPLVVTRPRGGRWREPGSNARVANSPRALRVGGEGASRSQVLNGGVKGERAGLARLVGAPGRREPLAGLPRLTLASDLHNNVLA